MTFYLLRIKTLPSAQTLYQNRVGYEGDSGLDVYCTEDVVIKAGTFGNTLSFGIQCDMALMKEPPMGDGPGTRISEYMSYALVPRSSISSTPLRMANSIGIIDAGYRGEIKAKVDNWSTVDYHIKRGDRLFQLVRGDLQPFSVQVLTNDEHLSKTSRGEGGFGSTGK